MNVAAHFRSLTQELEAIRDRVRNFSLRTPHWQTDGEWKESALRAMFSRCLPAHIEALRGFAVTQARGSGQIDILLYDSRHPVLSRSGDLVFVTPDAIVGIIEVKSNIGDRSALREALQSLADDAETIRAAKGAGQRLFVGLFAYTTTIQESSWQTVLDELESTANGSRDRIVNHACLGCSQFGKFWEASPDGNQHEPYDAWHYYTLTDMAAGYFINNVVAAAAEDSVARNEDVWFPAMSKELHRLGTKPFGTE